MSMSRTWRTRRVDIDHDREGAHTALKRSNGHDRRGRVHNRIIRALKSGWQKKAQRRFREQGPGVNYFWTVGKVT